MGVLIKILLIVLLSKACDGVASLWANIDDRLFGIWLDGKPIPLPSLNVHNYDLATEFLIPPSYNLDNYTQISIYGFNHRGESGIILEDKRLGIKTNSQWKCSRFYYPNWFAKDFDDSLWEDATIQDATNDGVYMPYIPEMSSDVQWIWHSSPLAYVCFMSWYCGYYLNRYAYCRYEREIVQHRKYHNIRIHH